MAVAENEVHEGDRPYLKVRLGGQAELKCCDSVNNGKLESHWLKLTKTGNSTRVQPSERISLGVTKASGKFCGTLLFKHVHLNDTGMYHCYRNNSDLNKSLGTYMQVYSKC